MIDLEDVIDAYVECGLWADAYDENGDPVEDARHEYGVSDLSDGDAETIRQHVEGFMESNRDLLDASGLSAEQIGHDLWLTRNGHGAGFWDRGLGDVGTKLTEACRPYGSAHFFVEPTGALFYEEG